MRSAPAFPSSGIPIHFAGSPTPPAPPQGYPYSSGSPTPLAPPQGYPYSSAGSPHPARAFGKGYSDTSSASSTPPAPRERGPCPGVYQGSSRARLFSGISPCTGPWRTSLLGVGLTGRGNSFPLPCFSRSNHPASRRSHPSLWQGTRIPRRQPPRPRLRRDTRIPRRHPPPHPRLRRSSPASSRGRGPCPGVYQVSSRARLFSGVSPCTGPWRTPPLGEAACGEEAEPSPLSLTPSGPRTSRRPCLSLRRREPGFLPAIPARGLPIQNPARDLQRLDRMEAAATKDK